MCADSLRCAAPCYRRGGALLDDAARHELVASLLLGDGKEIAQGAVTRATSKAESSIPDKFE
jgi:hypothetical protein